MKKLICMLLIAALAIGFTACAVPNTEPIYIGTWVGENATIVLNADGTGTITYTETDAVTTEYGITWRVHVKTEEEAKDEELFKSYHNNPDSIDILTVKGGEIDLETAEPNFPVLKANLNVTAGVLQLSLFDGNAKDDSFSLVATVELQG